jgi:NADP-dependent 3-hydroxy acid dehydrogenase YdfG
MVTASNDPRIAVVTGASSGIGAAIATALGALGWSVGLGARRTDRLEQVAEMVRAGGGTPFAHALDVTDIMSIDTFFGAVESTLGTVDTVVNNAGVGLPATLIDSKPDDLRREVDVNLLGPIFVSQRALQKMPALGYGDIVFVTSLNAVTPRPMQTGYTASKAGMEGVAKVLAMELEGTGIRATIVRPGPTITDFAAEWPEGVLKGITELWAGWGLWRHDTFLPPEAIAAAVVTAVTAAAGVHLDEIQINPVPPPGRGPNG